MRRIATALLCLASIYTFAQTEESTTKAKPFKHLDLAIEVGTTGIGIDFATPIVKNVKLRTGFTYMPKFECTIHFPIQFAESTDGSGLTQDEKFDKLSSTFNDFTGFNIDRNIDMIAKPTFWNFKFLVDVYPFRNKHWRVTGGFYLGPSKIGEAYNTTEDMTSLVSLSMYNKIWLKSINSQPLYGDFYVEDLQKIIENYGRMYSFQGYMNKYTEIVEGNSEGIIKSTEEINTLEPDEDGMMKAKAKVNNFRPYIGFGYEHDFGKDKQYSFGVDAGVMFWGGHPSIVTSNSYYYVHKYIDPENKREGDTWEKIQREVDLTRDVHGLPEGKVNDMVKTLKKFTAYPVINIRIARKLF